MDLNKIKEELNNLIPQKYKNYLINHNDYKELCTLYKTENTAFIAYCILNSYTSAILAECGDVRKYSNGKLFSVCNKFINNDRNSCPVCYDKLKEDKLKSKLQTILKKHNISTEQYEAIKSNNNIESDAEGINFITKNLSSIPLTYCGKRSRYIEGAYTKICDDNSCEICSKEKRKKFESSMIAKHGTKNALESKELLDKRNSTNIKKYGFTNPLNNEEVKQKAVHTNIQRYGVANPAQSKEIQEKIKSTNQNRYGVDNPAKSEEVQNKIKSTNLKKYGAITPLLNKEVQNKIKSTNKSRYNEENPLKSTQIQEKIKSTNLERYGYINAASSPLVINKIISTKTKNGTLSLSELSRQKQKSTLHIKRIHKLTEIARINGIECLHVSEDPNGYSTFKCSNCGNEFKIKTNENINIVCRVCNPLKVSTGEKELLEYIQSIYDKEILHNNRTVIAPKEIDIYIPELKIGFEYNDFKDEYSHQEKVLLCKEQGIKLIHIFEDEWNNNNGLIKERIKSVLGLSERIYARKCTLKELGTKECNEFLDKYHIQGACTSKVRVGLFCNNELRAVMTFGKPRFNKKYQYELIRYCSNGTVVGGASKLLKYFESTYHPESLISYADMNWSSGNLYDKLGFEFDSYTSPGFFYYDSTYNYRISRYKCQKHKLIKEGYDPSLTAEYICCNILGYQKIYDSGNLVYIKKYKE